MTNTAVARRFAQFGCSLSQIPKEVHHAADRAILDTLGAIIAGGVHPKTKALANGISHPVGSAILATGGRSDAATAARLNGMAAHVWDIDDTSFTGIMHGSAVVLPAVLAVAQEIDADHETTIRAFVVGSEIAYTLAELCTHDHYFHGWWSTVTLGLVGATASVGVLLCLDENAMTHSIGMAAAGSGGGKAVFGTDSKPLLIGDAASRAITFAKAAKAGLDGPEHVFEDDRGYFKLLNGGKVETDALLSLGKRWRLVHPGLQFKTSPVCSAAHAAIDQLVVLLSKLEAEPGEIVEVLVDVPDLVYISLVFNDPESPQQAQFSLPYAIACAALYGKVRFEDLLPTAIQAEEKRHIMKKVTVTRAADLSTDEMRKKYPESARLTIRLADGREASGFCGAAKGMPENPLEDEYLMLKFETAIQFAGRSGFEIPRLGSSPIEIIEQVMS